MKELTPALNTDDNFFGVLQADGNLNLFHYQLIDSRPKYLKYLKDLRKKTNSGQETEEELHRLGEEDVSEARRFSGLQLIIMNSETFNL